MTEHLTNDLKASRREAAILLGVDIEHLSAADSLRIDMVSALRLVIDHEQASVLSGGSADLGKLNVAVQSLIALLPGRELPAPESQREDPRETMWQLYRTMRERGELPLREIPDEGLLQAKITQLESENGQLRAALGGLIRPPKISNADRALLSVEESAITPREADDITPPSELGVECYAGMRPGPDDPKPPVTIEAKATRAAPPSRPQNWDDTPNGRAWQAWHDAGGNGSSDPWVNNNR